MTESTVKLVETLEVSIPVPADKTVCIDDYVLTYVYQGRGKWTRSGSGRTLQGFSFGLYDRVRGSNGWHIDDVRARSNKNTAEYVRAQKEGHKVTIDLMMQLQGSKEYLLDFFKTYSNRIRLDSDH